MFDFVKKKLLKQKESGTSPYVNTDSVNMISEFCSKNFDDSVVVDYNKIDNTIRIKTHNVNYFLLAFHTLTDNVACDFCVDKTISPITNKPYIYYTIIVDTDSLNSVDSRSINKSFAYFSENEVSSGINDFSKRINKIGAVNIQRNKSYETNISKDMYMSVDSLSLYLSNDVDKVSRYYIKSYKDFICKLILMISSCNKEEKIGKQGFVKV